MEQVLLECENFADLGGWTVETQSMRSLGSSYVMAHGYGVPVADARTTVDLAPGTYTVWAHTRNWNAEWVGCADGATVNAECKMQNAECAAGRFKVLVDGVALAETLGTAGGEWAWQKAGSFETKGGAVALALHDLTGFNGRCDALFLSTATEPPPFPTPEWRRAMRGLSIRDCDKEYDLIVVGGGMAGTCAAVAANRFGLRVLLLQDREMLGGCNSSEVRVALGGCLGAGDYPAIGRVVRDIQPLYGDGDPHEAKYYEDARKEIPFTMKKDAKAAWCVPFIEADLLYRQYVYAIEKDPSNPHRIAAVLARDTRTGQETRYRAPLFVDATGDAILSRLAGCATMYGREARGQFNEISAPPVADRQVMGHSTQWLTREAPAPMPFPDISAWALPIDDETGYYVTKGSWEQETGQYRDMAEETEKIRDYGLLAIFSNWHWLKNKSPRRAEFANRVFDWISPIGGKRESYRTVGDYILTQNDMENDVRHEDDTACITWNIDLHFPDPENVRKFKEPFRSAAYHRGTGNTPPVPYRCLYARDCDNLFLAGRHISCTHVAFAAVRVMRTLGQLGEVVGMAAKVCHGHRCAPRDVYSAHLDELKDLMRRGVPEYPTFHPGGNFIEDAFDFNRRGWVHLYPRGEEHVLTEQEKEQIRSQGFILRVGHRDLMDGRRRIVIADGPRGLVHYYDSFSPKSGYSIDIGRPIRALAKLDDGRYRADTDDGSFIVDMAARSLKGPESLEGPESPESLESPESPESLESRQIDLKDLKDFPDFPDKPPSFAAVTAVKDGGFWATTGYGTELQRLDADGRILSSWQADQGGKSNVFYGALQAMDDGSVYVANWTGPNVRDSFKGWQLIQFGPDGRVLWWLDSPDRFGSVVGFDVLETPEVITHHQPVGS